jgi:hypothetical protein
MTKRTIRIPDQLDQEIRKTAIDRGFPNLSALVRASLEALVHTPEAAVSPTANAVNVSVLFMIAFSFRFARFPLSSPYFEVGNSPSPLNTSS